MAASGVDPIYCYIRHFPFSSSSSQVCTLVLRRNTSWTLTVNHLLHKYSLISIQFSSVAQLCPTLCHPMDCSTPGLPAHHQLLEFTQTHVHWVGDAIQPSHPLSSPSSPAFSLSQHQGLFKWIGSSHQVAKVLEFQHQHQSFQWIFRTDFLWNGLVGSPCSPRDSQDSRVFSNTTVQKHQFFSTQLSL